MFSRMYLILPTCAALFVIFASMIGHLPTSVLAAHIQKTAIPDEWKLVLTLLHLQESDLFALDDEQLNRVGSHGPHIGFMDRIESVLGKVITKDQKESLRQHNLMFQYLSDQLVDRNLAGKITDDEYFDGLSLLFKGMLALNATVLSDREYKLLYETKKSEGDEIIDGTLSYRPPRFPVANGSIAKEDIYEKIPTEKINMIEALYKRYLCTMVSLNDQVEARKMTMEEAGRLGSEAYQLYVEEAARILTPEESRLIFGKDPVR